LEKEQKNGDIPKQGDDKEYQEAVLVDCNVLRKKLQRVIANSASDAEVVVIALMMLHVLFG
jgi:hypothetical protein